MKCRARSLCVFYQEVTGYYDFRHFTILWKPTMKMRRVGVRHVKVNRKTFHIYYRVFKNSDVTHNFFGKDHVA